jgi:hypothetical protein
MTTRRRLIDSRSRYAAEGDRRTLLVSRRILGIEHVVRAWRRACNQGEVKETHHQDASQMEKGPE